MWSPVLHVSPCFQVRIQAIWVKSARSRFAHLPKIRHIFRCAPRIGLVSRNIQLTIPPCRAFGKQFSARASVTLHYTKRHATEFLRCGHVDTMWNVGSGRYGTLHIPIHGFPHATHVDLFHSLTRHVSIPNYLTMRTMSSYVLLFHTLTMRRIPL